MKEGFVMKQSLYDWFDAYEGELPELETTACDTAQISRRVMAKIGSGRITVKRRRRWAAAAAVIIAAAACMGLTVGAAAGKLDMFRQVLRQTEITEQGTASLPLTKGDMPEMDAYLSTPDVVFEGNENMTVSLLGMYNDNASLMMTLQLTVHDGTVLTEEMSLMPFFTLVHEDGTEVLLSKSGLYADEGLLRLEEAGTDTWYLTYCLTDPDMGGSSLRVEIPGVYSAAQRDGCSAEIQALQAEWRSNYGADSMPAEEWKALWQELDLDSQNFAAQRSYLERTAGVMDGTWTADIAIPTAASAYTAAQNGIEISLDALSLSVTDAAHPDAGYACAVFLKDGTVLSEMQETLTFAEEAHAFGTAVPFAYWRGIADGRIYCYSEPLSSDMVEKVVVYEVTHDENCTALADVKAAFTIS